MKPQTSFALSALVLLAAFVATPSAYARNGVPHYDHIIVIIEENKDYSQIMNPAFAPNISALAAAYGEATQFFGEVHPSEGNYVALLGGDTYGVHDDDAFFCRPGPASADCPGAAAPGYQDHTVYKPSIGQQLEAAGLSWKGYYENIPAPGSLVVNATDPAIDDGTHPALYATKHSGFLNFAHVQKDPHRAEHLVGFDQWRADLAADRLPSFAFVVPNQCNEMHGLKGSKIPAACASANPAALIAQGDRVIGDLVRQIQATRAWRSQENVAIVITFDEGAGKTREGCCAVTPDAISNFGGGHIPTVVITNHGPKGIKDDTPYNHYSLLRTFEDAFGLKPYLGHAADTDKGVVSMVKLF